MKQKGIDASQKFKFFSLCVIMFSFTLSVNVLGPLMQSIINRFGLTFGMGGMISTFVNIGAAIAFIWGGMLSDRYDKSILIAISWLIHCAAMISMGYSPTYSVLLVIFLIHGFGSRVTELSLNAEVSDISSDRRAHLLNILHVFAGAGSLAGPLFAQTLYNASVQWDVIFRAAGIWGIAVLAIYISTSLRMRPISDRTSISKASLNPLVVIKDRRIWILCGIMLLFTGHLSGIIVWLPTYITKELSPNPLLASSTLSLYWLGAIIGRAASTKLTEKVSEKQQIAWGCLAGGAAVTIGIISGSAPTMAAMSCITGLLTGAAMPLMFSIACSWHPENSGMASSTLLLFAAAAWIIIPWLIGTIADQAGFRLGMSLIAASLAAAGSLGFIIPAKGASMETSRSAERLQ